MHKVFFSSEPAMRELLSHDIQQAADKIWPSLLPAEQDELTNDQTHLTQLLKNTLNSAKSRQAQLEQDAQIWHDYCAALEKARSLLELYQFNDEPVMNLAGLHYNIEKVDHAQNDISGHQSDIDLLNERAREITRLADLPNRTFIEEQMLAINREWEEVVSTMESRRDALTKLAQQWEEFESKWQALETKVGDAEDKAHHLDLVVRSLPQLRDSRNTLEELIRELEGSHPAHDEMLSLSSTIVAYLSISAEPASRALREKLQNFSDRYTRLISALKSKLAQANADLESLEAVAAEIQSLRSTLQSLDAEVRDVYVFGENQDAAEKTLQELGGRVDDSVARVKKLGADTKQRYTAAQQLVPTELAQELTSLELLSEALSAAMEEKDREAKRARTVRSDYVRDVDAVTAWIQRAELRVQDRSAEPQVLRDHLQQVQAEIGPTEDRLERLSRNARAIVDNSRDEEEKTRVQATVRSLTDQLQQVRAWLHDKKQQVGDSLDAWGRFLSLHQAVLSWAEEQTKFLATPLLLSSLTQARQRLHDYSTAVRSCKQAGKNLSDMSRELEQIGQVTSVGDLPDKLQAAEDAKVRVEAQLLERNALLQETSEEWERCERKMKEVRAWLEKSQQALDSPQNRKRPLRDQHAQRDKMLADAATQKTKIALSVEKLQIHFRAGVGGDSRVTEEASQLIADLDRLMTDVKEQITTLESCLSQLDQYQHEIQQLRTQIVSVEAQLRAALSPNYSPHDRDHALNEQNARVIRDTAQLAEAVAQSEEQLGKLPADSLSSMHAELERILAELMAKDAVAARVQDSLDCLPPDDDTQALSYSLSEVRAHLAELVTHILQGRAAVQNAEQRGASRQHAVERYQKLLAELERWIASASHTVRGDVHGISVSAMRDQLAAHERLASELQHHNSQLSQLERLCTDLQRQPDTQHLAPALLAQLSSVQEAFLQLQDLIPARIAALQVPGAHSVILAVGRMETVMQ